MGKLTISLVLCLAVSAYAGFIKTSEGEVRDDVDWWENGVFYQIYPRSFKDSNNDGTGDIKGITAKLEHLKELGVTGTWLSPIFDSPMIDGGYDIRDYRKVNPMYGTNDDLKELFAKAKELGLKVILDFVPNHSSDQHEWFIKSANREPGYDDYYTWRDCPVENGQRRLPNNWIAVFNGPMWTYDPRRNQCYLHQFTKEQPDLNFRRPDGKITQEMMDILTFWMGQGAHGFRVDAINHAYESASFTNQKMLAEGLDPNLYESYETTYTKDLNESYYFIYTARKHLDKYKTDNKVDSILLMTEAYATTKEQTQWYGVDKDTRGSHIPFNFAFISDITSSSSAADFKKAIDQWMDYMPSFTMGQANWVLGNHDRSRLRSRFGEDRYESMAIMSMMLPGVAIVYYGEEIGMSDNNAITWEETEDPQACQSNRSVYHLLSRDPVRTPMQWDESANGGFCPSCKTWLPVHSNYRTLNVKAQENDEKSTFQLYKDLIKMKKEKDVLKFGGLETKLLGNNEVLAFERTIKDKSTIAVLMNIGKSKTVNLGDLFSDEDKSSKTKATVLIANNKATLKKGTVITDLTKVTLGDYDAVVFEMSSATTLAKTALYAIAAFWVVMKFLL